MSDIHNIIAALQTLGGNIETPEEGDTMAEMIFQTKCLCLDAADKLTCLAKASEGLAKKYYSIKRRKLELEEELAALKTEKAFWQQIHETNNY
jgi:hypothetical protein